MVTPQLVEVELGIAGTSQQLIHNGAIALQNATTLQAAGVKDQDMLLARKLGLRDLPADPEGMVRMVQGSESLLAELRQHFRRVTEVTSSSCSHAGAATRTASKGARTQAVVGCRARAASARVSTSHQRKRRASGSSVGRAVVRVCALSTGATSC